MRRMDVKTKNLVMSAVFAALICVSTFIIKIPSPIQGYINLGDCFVLLAGWTLSRRSGFLAAAVGSALADIISGYAVFAPATFIIKGLMVLIANYCLGAIPKNAKKAVAAIVSGIAAECVMILGYLIYESFLYGFNAALAGVPFNAIQGAVCIIPACILYELIGVRIAVK